MIEALTGMGYAIISLAVIIGIGIIILSTFGSNVAGCPTGYAYNTNGSTTFATNTCCLTNGPNCNVGLNTTSASTATQNVNTLAGYLGTSSGGLATWVPIIIVLVIGILFLGVFLTRKKN